MQRDDRRRLPEEMALTDAGRPCWLLIATTNPGKIREIRAS